MPAHSLLGTRIRERRISLGLKQAELARLIGISASYLNLIEHNRRRIAGKLVTNIADQLKTDVASLSEGAEDAVIAALNEVMEMASPDATAPERAEDLTGRFPGWSSLIAAQQARIKDLERTVETLTDRMTHDPFLSTSLHEVISAVTSIRSTSSILRDDEGLDGEWLGRFHSNLYEDAVRLADSSQGLVRYLDTAQDTDATGFSPQDELEARLAEAEYYLPSLEKGGTSGFDVSEMSASAQDLAQRYFKRYAQDAARICEADILRAIDQDDIDPAVLAVQFDVDIATMLRRLSVFVGRGQPNQAAGLVICDTSGTFTFRKPAAGFPVPRFGAACPLWPLFSALSQPMVPLRTALQMAGRGSPHFTCFAVAHPLQPFGFSAARAYEATMLILPSTQGAASDLRVGTSCRICPETDCPARREQSILA